MGRNRWAVKDRILRPTLEVGWGRGERERERKVNREGVGGLGEARGRPLSPVRRYDEGLIFSPEKEETVLIKFTKYYSAQWTR